MEGHKKRKLHYAWIVMIACICIKIGTGGAMMAATGNFITPVVKELGCQVSAFTMFISIEAIAMALFYTTASRILVTKRIGLVMGIASLAEVIGLALMSTYQNVYMFYVSGAVIGIAQAFTGFVAVPIVLNMWFHKKTGTVLGIVVAVGSAATVGYGLFSATLITQFGWRTSYLILAAIGFILTVPAVFLLIKSPAEVGCEPYGAEETQPATSVEKTPTKSGHVWGLTRKQAFSAPFLYFAWIACLCYSYGSGVGGYVATFSTMELGQSIYFGAHAAMYMSIGGIACSLILGYINDRFGVKTGLIWGAFFTAIGYVTMLMSFQNPTLVYAASFSVGLGSSMYTVQCPLLARSIVGTKHFSEIWSIMMMVNSLIGGGLYSSIGLFYDKGGSYRGAFIMGMSLYIGAMIFGSISIILSNRHKAAMAY